MKKITLTWLKKHDACEEAIVEWRERKLRSMDVCDLLRLLLKEEKHDWANWLFFKRANRKQQLKYVIHAAELALPIFEKEYPNDKRSRLAIEAAKRVLENDTRKNSDAALAAGNAAWSAARAAAWAAAWDAAWKDILNYGISLLEAKP